MAGVAISGFLNYSTEMESESLKSKGHTESGSHKRERNEENVSDSDNENGCESEEKKNEAVNEERNRNAESVNGRKRLLIPQNCALNFMEKLRWTMQLGPDHRVLEPLLKEGRGRPYLTIWAGSGEQILTTQGYKGAVMNVPKAGEKLTKVIIFQNPTIMDPDFLVDDESLCGVRGTRLRARSGVSSLPCEKSRVQEGSTICGATSHVLLMGT